MASQELQLVVGTFTNFTVFANQWWETEVMGGMPVCT